MADSSSQNQASSDAVSALAQWDAETWARLGLMAAAIPLIFILTGILTRYLGRRWNQQAGMLIGRGVRYVLLLLICLMVLRECGFQITPLLGTLGIVGVAVGFASQTSLGNIIAGFFLLSDRAVAIGDLVSIDGTRGTIHSIDLLSIKVLTVDNQLIRVPNETVLKMNLVTINKFAIRRLDIQLSVAYKEDVDKVRALLTDIANNEDRCLDEPEPMILFQNFGASGLDFLFAVWVQRDDVLQVKNALMDTIKRRFDEAGIEIPFPHMSLYAGSATEPIPVRMMPPEDLQDGTDSSVKTPTTPGA